MGSGGVVQMSLPKIQTLLGSQVSYEKCYLTYSMFAMKTTLTQTALHYAVYVHLL